jgi:xylulokinase
VAGASIVKIASTGTVVVVTDRAVADRRLLAYPHVLPGLDYVAAATNTAATAYGWLRETVFGHQPEPPQEIYREMDRLAARVPAGADGLLFLPFLEGERTPFWDWRLRAGFVGLTSAHRKEHFCRAVLEGVALSLRMCRDVVEEAGAHVREPVLAGGGVASRLWRDILVAVLDQPSRTVEPQGPAIGAALIACAASTGTDLAAVKLQQRRHTIEPRGAWTDVYRDRAEVYAMAAEALRPVSYRLGGVRALDAEDGTSK